MTWVFNNASTQGCISPTVQASQSRLLRLRKKRGGLPPGPRRQKEKRPARKILTGRSFILTSIVDVIRLNQADAGGATGTA